MPAAQHRAFQNVQQPQLGIEVESVAALALHRRDAHLQHSLQHVFAVLEKFFRTCRARFLHRRDDPAAATQKFQVRDTREPVVKFLGTGPGKEEMRMRIDEARHGTAAAAIDHLSG